MVYPPGRPRDDATVESRPERFAWIPNRDLRFLAQRSATTTVLAVVLVLAILGVWWVNRLVTAPSAF